jgi:hypothetical protein
MDKLVISLISTTLLLSSCGQSGFEVKREDYGKDWPFSVEKGVVDCVDRSAAIFKVGDKSYSLNGTAKGRGYASIDSIWLDDPELPGLKMDVSPMRDLALKQCR